MLDCASSRSQLRFWFMLYEKPPPAPALWDDSDPLADFVEDDVLTPTFAPLDTLYPSEPASFTLVELLFFTTYGVVFLLSWLYCLLSMLLLMVFFTSVSVMSSLWFSVTSVSLTRSSRVTGVSMRALMRGQSDTYGL